MPGRSFFWPDGDRWTAGIDKPVQVNSAMTVYLFCWHGSKLSDNLWSTRSIPFLRPTTLHVMCRQCDIQYIILWAMYYCVQWFSQAVLLACCFTSSVLPWHGQGSHRIQRQSFSVLWQSVCIKADFLWNCAGKLYIIMYSCRKSTNFMTF